MIKFIKILIVVLVVALLLAGLRLCSYEQEVNTERLQYKKDYLKQIATLQLPLTDKPNIVFILFDDLGFGDIGIFASATGASSSDMAIKTPSLDKLARQGTRFNNFYTPSPVCTPSRAGMLTGRYPPRAGLTNVSFPDGSTLSNIYKLSGGNVQLPAEEITLANVLQAAGYRTGMVGKWHLGDQPGARPNDFGFQYFYGALYSNDMSPFSIWRNEEQVHEDLQDQSTLTEQYTREAVGFIEQNADQPFFLYLPHNFPHIPLFASTEQAGKSNAGLYGDVVEDLDRGVAEIVASLERRGILDNTLIIVTSDNGPWYQGSPGNSRGRKGTTFDGGMRVPFFVRWPAQVPAGQASDALLSGVDILPTLLALLDLPAPQDRQLDGIDVWAQFTGLEHTEERSIYYYKADKLEALRNTRFKYQAKKGYSIGLGNVLIDKGPFLFDYRYDGKESYDVSMSNEGMFEQLQSQFHARLEEMQSNPRGWK